MKISMHGMSAAMFTQALNQLHAILGKAITHAKARNYDPNVLASARLAPDMFALNRQVQLTCDFAKNSVARLAGIDPPRIEDTETTLDELQARVTKTLEFLQSIQPAALEGSETRDIKIPLRTRTLEMQGLPFLQNWALPNFYFHYTTSYDILRHNGVEIGKNDFLGS
jgi:uncharacterized protein